MHTSPRTSTLLITLTISGLALLSPEASKPAFAQNPAFSLKDPLIPAGLQNGDSLGQAIDLEGENAIVSALETAGSNPAFSTGSAYFLQRIPNGRWTVSQKVQGQSGSGFGQSVAISGSTAVVGMTDSDTTIGTQVKRGAGSVYVYEYNTSRNRWEESQILTASDANDADAFGTSVDLDGNTLVVGAINKDAGSTLASRDTGAVYVFTRNGPGQPFSQRQIVVPPGTSVPDAKYGYSVSLDQDTLLVGSPEYVIPDGESVQRAGLAFLYTRTNSLGNFNFSAPLTAQNSTAGDNFGTAVKIEDQSILIGAPRHDQNGLSDAGAVYHYQLTPSLEWTFIEEIQAPQPRAEDQFGATLDLHQNQAVIGAFANDNGEVILGLGGAYWYERSAQRWAFQRRLDPQVSDERQAGIASAVAAGQDTAMVGALGGGLSDNAETGVLFIFDDQNPPPLPAPVLPPLYWGGLAMFLLGLGAQGFKRR